MSTRWSGPELELARPPSRPKTYNWPWILLVIMLAIFWTSLILTTIAVWRMI